MMSQSNDNCTSTKRVTTKTKILAFDRQQIGKICFSYQNMLLTVCTKQLWTWIRPANWDDLLTDL